MVIFVKVLGVIIGSFGVIYLSEPEIFKTYVLFWTKGKRIYSGGVLSMFISVILLLAASQCRLPWFVALLGICALIKGVVIFSLGPQKLVSRLNWWAERPVGVVRLLGVLALAIGALLVFSA